MTKQNEGTGGPQPQGQDRPAVGTEGQRAGRGEMVEDSEGRKGGAGTGDRNDANAGAAGTGSGERGGGGWSEATGGPDGRKTGGDIGHDEDAGGGGRHS